MREAQRSGARLATPAVLVPLYARDERASRCSSGAAPTCAATPARSRSRAAAATPGDADLADTALREAEEEIGLAARRRSELLGELPPTPTFVTDYRDLPVRRR